MAERRILRDEDRIPLPLNIFGLLNTRVAGAATVQREQQSRSEKTDQQVFHFVDSPGAVRPGASMLRSSPLTGLALFHGPSAKASWILGPFRVLCHVTVRLRFRNQRR